MGIFVHQLAIASDLAEVLTVLLRLQCLTAKPAMMPCRSFHVPPRLLASYPHDILPKLAQNNMSSLLLGLVAVRIGRAQGSVGKGLEGI